MKKMVTMVPLQKNAQTIKTFQSNMQEWKNCKAVISQNNLEVNSKGSPLWATSSGVGKGYTTPFTDFVSACCFKFYGSLRD